MSEQQNVAAAEEERCREICAAVIHFSTLHAAALQTNSKIQQELVEETSDTLEKLCLGILKSKASQFMEMKQLFDKLPSLVLELIWQGCGPHWYRLPLVNLMITPLTRHVTLDFTCPVHLFGRKYFFQTKVVEGEWQMSIVHREELQGEKPWTVESVSELRHNLSACAKNLLTLNVNQSEQASCYAGFSATQLQALLLETRSLTTFKVIGLKSPEEYDIAVGIVVDKNPNLRSLHTESLTSSGLKAIADHCQKLQELAMLDAMFSKEEMASALNRLPHLQAMSFNGSCKRDTPDSYIGKGEVLVRAAEMWDPASPPLALTGWMVLPSWMTPQQVRQVFTCFPRLDAVCLYDECVAALCEGLAGLTTNINKVEFNYVTEAKQREVLAVVNEQLTTLKFFFYQSDNADCSVNLGLLAGACPKVENLDISAGSLRLSPNFEPLEEAFTQLSKCSIVLHQRDPNHASSASMHSLIHQLLSGRQLETLKFQKLPIPDRVVADLVSADPGQRVLSSLRSLQFDQEDVSLDAAISLVSHAPRLRRVEIHYVVNSEEAKRYRQVMTHFMAVRMPYVSFKKVQHTPTD